MRIVAGKLRGRAIPSPSSSTIRPTSDRVREAIGSALEARGAFADAHVLDLFAGTGALALEAVSRGAVRAVCVDVDPATAKAIERTAAELGVQDAVSVRIRDLTADPNRVAAGLRKEASLPFNLVFVDPPYNIASVGPALLSALAESGVIGRPAWIVIEYATRNPVALDSPFVTVAEYKYGDTQVLLASLD